MTNPAIIPTNFRVLKGFRHEWALFVGDRCVGHLFGIPGQMKIHHAFVQPPPSAPAMAKHQVMHWIQEAVEHLRFICEK